jgi:hypothetical protein
MATVYGWPGRWSNPQSALNGEEELLGVAFAFTLMTVIFFVATLTSIAIAARSSPRQPALITSALSGLAVLVLLSALSWLFFVVYGLATPNNVFARVSADLISATGLEHITAAEIQGSQNVRLSCSMTIVCDRKDEARIGEELLDKWRCFVIALCRGFGMTSGGMQAEFQSQVRVARPEPARAGQSCGCRTTRPVVERSLTAR